MPATAAIRVATRALRGCATVCVLGALCCAPAKALSFAWSFKITGASNSSYIGQTISGTIDNLQDNTKNMGGMTATITSAPFYPSNGMSWSSIGLSYGGGNGIQVENGAVVTTGLQAYFVYNSDRLELNTSRGELDAYASNPKNIAYMDGTVIQFTPVPVPAPLPLLGLGAAAAFSRKLKQRISLRHKRAEVELAC